MLLASLRQLRCLRELRTCSTQASHQRQASVPARPADSAPPPSAVDGPRPKLHWTEEFKIRSPKVSPGQLRSEPVVAINIESDAFTDRRIAFVLRRALFFGPIQPKWRGVAKILSWISLGSLPYLMFCKWAGGTPLLGDMATYAIPATVSGVSLGYLGLNLALERSIFHRRIYSVALDETNPELVYISMMPVGGWLHGSFRSFVTRLDNINVEMTGGSWAKLTFKSGGVEGDWLSLPVGSRKCFVVDARAMAAFSKACAPAAATRPDPNRSDSKSFDQVVLPSDSDIDRHLDSALGGSENSAEDSQQPQQQKQHPKQQNQ